MTQPYWCAGATSGNISQFSGVGAVLLGSDAVYHQKDGLGDAVHHGNNSCRIAQRRRQYIPRYGMWRHWIWFCRRIDRPYSLVCHAISTRTEFLSYTLLVSEYATLDCGHLLENLRETTREMIQNQRNAASTQKLFPKRKWTHLASTYSL